MDETKRNDHWRAIRMSLRETVIVVFVSALAFGVFFGMVKAMGPSPQATETAPAATAPVSHDPMDNDAASSTDSPDESVSAPPG